MEPDAAKLGDGSRRFYSNSVFLMGRTAIMAVLGFFFWLVAARTSPPREIGLATTLISVMTYIAMISQMGANVALVRYLPGTARLSERINTCLTIVFLAASLFSVVFLLGASALTSEFLFLEQDVLHSVSFVGAMVVGALYVTYEGVFIGLRKSVYVLLRDSLWSVLKLVFVFLIGTMGAYGIFSSWVFATLAGLVASHVMLRLDTTYRPKLQILKDEVKEMARFSVANYAAGLVGNIPQVAIPFMLTTLVSPSVTAHYYVAMTYASLLYSVPVAVCNSLFAEGAADQQTIIANIRRSIGLILIILLPAVALTVALGQIILGQFGAAYSENSVQLLSILALSSFFVATNTVCWTLLNLKNRLNEIVLVLVVSVGMLLTLILLMIDRGVQGVGIAWIVSQGAASFLYLVAVSRSYPLSGGIMRPFRSARS